MKNKTMMVDFYEHTMAQTYFDNGGKDVIVYFDMFYRRKPFEGGYAISGGLDNIVQFIKRFKINEEDIAYLRTVGDFTEDYLEYLKNLKFTGDVYAIPDGTPIFPNEPVVTVKTNIIEASLIETAILTNFNHGTLVTTAAKRIVNAAGNIPVMEFGARRARGDDSATQASKYAYVGGCAGTSNVQSAKENGIPVMGTMAHAMISAFDTEYDAFLAYAKSNPKNCVFLVDTYNTLKSGVPNAIRVAKEYLLPNGYKLKGIRIDSGDLAYLSKKARKMLDDAGFEDAGICLSNGLNETTIKSLLEQGAYINSIGCGDNIAASKERVDGVYKLVAVEKDGKIIPKIKVSEDAAKTINPGYKKVYRFYDKETGFALGDVLALYNEVIPEGEYTLVSPTEEWKKTTITNYYVRELQIPIFLNGKLVYNVPSVKEARNYCTEQFKTLYPEIKRKENPHGYYVDLSEKLLELKKKMIMDAREEK